LVPHEFSSTARNGLWPSSQKRSDFWHGWRWLENRPSERLWRNSSSRRLRTRVRRSAGIWHLASLRAADPILTDSLHATRDMVGLVIPTDVSLFRAGAKRVIQCPDAPDACAVLDLYRGDLLAGLSISATAEFDDWLYVEQERLRTLFRAATVAFARCALADRRAADALTPLARLVTVDPYFEEGHLLLIQAYEAVGRREQAAAVYDRYQRIVRHDLHVEPRSDVAQRYEQASAVHRALPEEDLVPLRNVTVHIVDWSGADPAVLGIHGSGASAYVMSALAEQIAPAARFIGLDLRGHGFSDKPPGGYTLHDHVEDVCELVSALGLRRPILLGHSAGGTIAAYAAARIDASGLILLEGMIGDRAFTENAAAQSAPIATVLGRRFAGFDEYLAAIRMGRSAWSDDAERLLDRLVHYELAPLPDGSYRRRALRRAVEAEWASIVDADSLATLGQVRCPILIVQASRPWFHGRPYFSDAIVEGQLRAAPAAEVFIARHSNHATLVRDPEPEMIAAIQQFLARCSTAHHEGAA
jgi:pimeloyl-ACP methyl ester carboxylesterase/DNA-binding SARP family transcriptional activator